MHDGRPELITFIETLGWNAEPSLESLHPRWPGGFAATFNPHDFSIVGGHDRSYITLFGPAGNGVTLRVIDRGGEPHVKGIDVIIAIANLLRVGPPTFQRSPVVLADWWKNQIAGCEPFEVPEPAPRTRPEMDAHIDACAVCQPVSQAMASAINAGSSAYGDEDVADMIERSHLDQVEAISHYRQKAAAHGMHAAPSSVKRSRKAEVPA